MKFLLSSFAVLLLFIGCGYKPTSYYAKSSIVGAVYVDLKVDIDNSENSVFVKDAMNEMILNQFDVVLVDDKSMADTYVTVELSNVSHTSISTDEDGFVQSYRTSVTVKMTYQKIDEKKYTVEVNDYYDYTVDSDSTITDQKKKIAIKIAASKAFSNIFSKIAVNSMKD
jgi:hypothetical protein